MVGFAERAFEAVEHVDHIGEAGRFDGESGVDVAAAVGANRSELPTVCFLMQFAFSVNIGDVLD
jgi:hypothetical protein